MSDRPKLAYSLDLDGVIISRGLLRIQTGALIGFTLHGNHVYDQVTIPDILNREMNNTPISKLSEMLSYRFHVGRGLMPDALEFLEEKSQTADLFANTGRRNKRDWVNVTRQSLYDGGSHNVLPNFTDYFYKPENVRGVQSKAHAIKSLQSKYEKVIHVDDNPADVLPIASLFPAVEFYIVQDLTTGILFSRIESAQYPNVHRVAKLLEI